MQGRRVEDQQFSAAGPHSKTNLSMGIRLFLVQCFGGLGKKFRDTFSGSRAGGQIGVPSQKVFCGFLGLLKKLGIHAEVRDFQARQTMLAFTEEIGPRRRRSSSAILNPSVVFTITRRR